MSGITQYVDTQAVEDGKVAEASDHGKEGELAEVEYSSGGKRASEEEDHRGGRGRVKS